MELVVVLGIIAIVIVKVAGMSKPPEPNSTWSGTVSDSDIIESMRGDGSYSLNVVGESFYQAQLDNICGGKKEEGHEHITTAKVIPYDSNTYDDHAVKVEIDNMTIGHLSRKDARRYRFKMGSKITICPAMITGGWKRKDGRKVSEGHYGVRLDLEV